MSTHESPPDGGHDTGPPSDDRERCFTTLFEQTYTPLRRFAERRVHPSHADDVVSETFVVVWRRLEDLPRDADDARAWVFGVARGVMLNARRSDRRQAALAVRIAQEPASAHPTEGGEHPDLVAGRVDLARAWSRLSPVHQEALALTVWDGLDAPRAARVLGISPVAYRLRLSRARRALRAHAGALPQTSPASRGSVATTSRRSTT
ncbi:RNA polymerase sigma factor [Humibacillus xanthopallidus]|uniref:RNA polymerase sigma-70 factor (ECF subfamily) n=1 Tax=Humibacillus xanthopallidus TaxID=412689 RepID=A0A543I1C0_9MICO|nr:sigma-70 family RNA polymerase sigma factor [Humibacillus xanthopallidus]TQM64351.1 RNA polymerase sigma-70 factor (ECF subfamily) [Humibacillus xanthopallidus]